MNLRTPSSALRIVEKRAPTPFPQLPREGPGVIWIRIPDNMWAGNIDKSFNQAQELLESELKGQHNRRVNALVLTTKIFRKVQKNGVEGLAYTPLTMAIEHENPRYPNPVQN